MLNSIHLNLFCPNDVCQRMQTQRRFFLFLRIDPLSKIFAKVFIVSKVFERKNSSLNEIKISCVCVVRLKHFNLKVKFKEEICGQYL